MRLSIFFQQNKEHYKNYLLLLIICLLAYWPLTFGVFSVKNDAIHYFLPYRFSISEALRNGEFPFWSPYLYMGNPILGDMQSNAWNPIVWFFSAIGRYDITLFHFENLLYIFLGGVGMYKLTYHLVEHPHTALLIAVSYLLSGFMLGGQLINWLSAAAFIPFVIHYYLLTLHKSSIGYAVKTGIALFFLFTSSYPSFTILTLYLLFILFIVATINKIRKKQSTEFSFKKFLLPNLLIVVIFVGLSLPALVSFIDLLPYYQRGSGASYAAAVSNSFETKHLSTLLFPSTIKANDIISSTDVTCRNIYFGLFPLMILFAIPTKFNHRNILLISLAIFSLLFSFGEATPVRKICYSIIPLMDTFRHPSQMRLFFILSMLLLASPGLKKILTGELTIKEIKRLKLVLWITGTALVLISIITGATSKILNHIIVFKTAGFRQSLKNIIEAVSLNDAITLNAIIQLLFVAGYIFLLGKSFKNKFLFSFLWIANLFLMAQLVLPASFVSKVSPRDINAIIHSSPKGFPLDSLQNPIAENSKDAFNSFNTIGISYFYNKKIGLSKVTNSPAFLVQQDKFTQTNLLYNYISSLPVAYIADTVLALKDTSILNQTGNCRYAFTDDIILSAGQCNSTNKATIKKISANHFIIETETSGPSFLVLAQNYYHHWQISLDGENGKIIRTNMAFMGTVVPAGRHTVSFSFVPKSTIKAMWIQLVVIIALLLSGLFILLKSKQEKV